MLWRELQEHQDGARQTYLTYRICITDQAPNASLMLGSYVLFTAAAGGTPSPTAGESVRCTSSCIYTLL